MRSEQVTLMGLSEMALSGRMLPRPLSCAQAISSAASGLSSSASMPA